MSKVIQKNIYSLDKLILEFVMRTSDAQSLMSSYGSKLNVSQWVSGKLSVCRYNYSFEVQDCFGDSQSFWIGFQPNWKKYNGQVTFGRVEFNPSKVGDLLEFQGTYLKILSLVDKINIKPIRFDLAIDIPVDRSKVQMLKDKRTYEEYSNSDSDRTQYLGPRNAHGRVKVYNKALERKLDIELTRVELTIDYDKRSLDEVKKILPNLYLLDSFQFPIGITGTDKVLLIAIMGDFSLLGCLPRDKKAKIKSYLADMKLDIAFNVDNYNIVLEQIQEYI